MLPQGDDTRLKGLTLMVGVGNVPHHTNVCVFRLGRVVMLHVNVRVVLLGVGILGAVFSGGDGPPQAAFAFSAPPRRVVPAAP